MKHTRILLQWRTGLVLALLVALMPFMESSAHLTNHPQIYTSEGATQAYWSYNHAWRSSTDVACGGKYTLAIANVIQRTYSSTIYFQQTRTYAYDLTDLNPSAGGFQLISSLDGSSQWFLSFTGWTPSNTIPTSGYIYYNANFTAPASSSSPAWMKMYSAAGNNFGSVCEHLDKVFYYP